MDRETSRESVFGDFVSRLTPYEGEEPDDRRQAVNLELARQHRALGITPDDPRYEVWLEYASTVRRAGELLEQLATPGEPAPNSDPPPEHSDPPSPRIAGA